MTAYAALLRAVNVAGTGKLAMADLRAMGAACGFTNVRTFIASGNLLLASDLGEAAIIERLTARLDAHMGRPSQAFLRSAAELAAVVAADPFPDAHPSRHLVYFHAAAPAADLIARCTGRQDERLALRGRELYVDYGAGIRITKLKIPGKLTHTARSINSVRRMAALLAG